MILAFAFLIKGNQSQTTERLSKLVGKDGALQSGGTPTKFLGKNQETFAMAGTWFRSCVHDWR